MAPPPVPPAGSLRLRILNLFTRLNVIAYRASGGRLGGRMQKAPVCILHTVGRRSGKRRETPLLYLADGDKVVLVASAGGRETSPAWYHNLRAMDAAEIEILGRRTKMTPRLASAEERAGCCETQWRRASASAGGWWPLSPRGRPSSRTGSRPTPCARTCASGRRRMASWGWSTESR